ncbi:MAG: hypothetical protein EA383_16695 [Spirochaetaceae bacterium]|nr:MAG: hypothetical protein EA383_16695 [Spirochaetaceae bacterium]
MTNVQDKTNVQHDPQSLALLLFFGVVVGVLGSLYGWFAPVHELSHAMMVWVFGGTVHEIQWDYIEWSGIPFGSTRFRIVIAAGAAGEHLVALVVMIWALLRARPFLSAIGAGYLAHGMNFATGLAEWRYLRPIWFVYWEMMTMLVYILLIGIAVTYVSWVAYAVAEKARARVARTTVLAKRSAQLDYGTRSAMRTTYLPASERLYGGRYGQAR